MEKSKGRRSFIKKSTLSTIGLIALNSCTESKTSNVSVKKESVRKPIVISTWDHGMVSNSTSWDVLKKGGTSLDAVEAGVRVIESDPKYTSVGYGGLPDRDGHVTLDACIMNHQNECGAVAFIENIKNPISVARKVMETTPHVMLVGQGAYEFAIRNGFEHEDLLTTNAKNKWQDWLQNTNYKPVINIENHDTIGSLALDSQGNLAGACTTSGMAFKMHGRVGDSPIIGAGMFVDNEVGAACATGVGEAVIRIAGSAIVVELMRHGRTPQEACEEAVFRIIQKHSSIENLQVGFLALDKFGNYGAYSIYSGFNYAVSYNDRHELSDAEFKYKIS